MRNITVGFGLIALIVLGISGCTIAPPEPTVAPTATADDPPASDESMINGIYEVTITQEDLRAAGVTEPAALAEHAGTYYWTFADGVWAYEQVSDQPLENPNARGTYTIDGAQYTHNWSDDAADVTTATVAVTSELALQFTDIADADPAFQQISEAIFGLHPWVRIGEVTP